MKAWAIVPAAGMGSRMGLNGPKQYLQVHGKRIIDWTLQTLTDFDSIEHVLVGIQSTDSDWPDCEFSGHVKVSSFVGGQTRAETVAAGLEALADKADMDDWVLVHDAARAGLTQSLLSNLYLTLCSHSVGGILALPVRDTLKRVSSDTNAVLETVSRDALWAAQTPQMFRYGALRSALQHAAQRGLAVTDEASAIEHMGLSLQVVPGDASNIKLTFPGDKKIMASQLSDRTSPSSVRIGQGYDVHAFEPGDHIMLGGVRIAHDQGFAAHSDGDVLLHAIADAMLGALALGDIGHHFPDTDNQWKNADSFELLAAVAKICLNKGYVVSNLDTTICAQEPKMAPHIDAMRARIAQALQVDLTAVSVKATTTERLGFVGKEEGVACYATCLMNPLPNFQAIDPHED